MDLIQQLFSAAGEELKRIRTQQEIAEEKLSRALVIFKCILDAARDPKTSLAEIENRALQGMTEIDPSLGTGKYLR